MNERIKQLWDDAALEAGDESNTWDGQVAFMALFAELIVKECISKIETEASQYHEPVWAFELVNDIKEHFGVEE